MVPHGAVFGPEASTASVLMESVSPVTPHAYCTSGAPALKSSANATRTRVDRNVEEREIIPEGELFLSPKVMPALEASAPRAGDLQVGLFVIRVIHQHNKNHPRGVKGLL